MAGDIGMRERVLVRSFEAAADPAGVPGGVVHEYGPRVVVAAAPDGVVVPQGMGDAADLDETGALGMAAFALRESEEFASAKANRPLDGVDWGDGDAPDHFDDDEPRAEAGAALSARLTGRVAVGVVIVEGPTDALRFSADERTKVVAEVQNGLSWLGAQSSPGGVTWVHSIRTVNLTVQADASLPDDQKEAHWRDPAMAALGFPAGMAGVTAYAESLRTSLRTDWAYVAFFTKYPLKHFGYASIGGPRLVMAYANDGWGPDNIDRVFAHETGHVFGAPDEYASSGCTCGGSWGFFGKPNANCDNCATDPVPCIMKSNSWEVCNHTPYHLGFPQGQRYSGVFTAGGGGYGLWVNADWNHFVAKWQEWSGAGLRLDELEISKPGGQLRYSGVFSAGTGGYGLWALADWNSFVAKWQEWSGQGLRLVDLDITDVNGQPRYSGVFRAGTGGYGLWVNAEWNNFVAKWQEWSAQGLRLDDLTITTFNGQVRYSGVFSAGSGGYGLWVNADWTSFAAKWQEWSGQGLRLVDLDITEINGQPRYSGVFRAGTGGYGLWVNSDWTSFLEKWQQWSAQGLRLVDFDVTLTGIESLVDAAGEAVQAEGDVAVLDLIPEGMGFSSLSPEVAIAGEMVHNGADDGSGEPAPGVGFLSEGVAVGLGERSEDGAAELAGFGAMSTD
ncbi:hypothetical protein [Actinokineospora fastidiosa]|uniref:Uncharacterized protein n=1 Tax=Actinokineospora fastidiosa TaxID=1816 RepID=A0A918G2B4_9PSEU|nr:hypothetical protein [Actinokineospora fastidiosa]GGS15800.1 hypothetical protein GCM10010171_04890 [Actinokineospora fastidiosa]